MKNLFQGKLFNDKGMISTITGSSGFLGSILKNALLENGFSVSDFKSRQDNGRIDITQPFDFENLVDVVVHCAGKAHRLPRTLEEEQAFYKVNLGGTQNLCNAIEKFVHKPNSFIFISTVSVYGLDEGKGIDENFPLLGTTPYAKSKILAEQFLVEWAKKNDIVLGILRLPLIAGLTPPGNLGAMIKGIKTGRYLSIGDASAKKSIVWAEDIANVIPKLAEIGGTYNLTDTYHPTFGELEKEISKCLGKKDPIKIPLWLARLLGKVGDLLGNKAPINSDKISKITSTLTFDDSKAREQLSWKPTKVLDKIAEIV